MGWFLGHSVFSGLCCYCVFHLKIPLRDERHYAAGSCWLLRCTPDGYGNIFFRYSWLALFACIGEVVGNILEVKLARFRRHLMLIQPKSKAYTCVLLWRGNSTTIKVLSIALSSLSYMGFSCISILNGATSTDSSEAKAQKCQVPRHRARSTIARYLSF